MQTLRNFRELQNKKHTTTVFPGTTFGAKEESEKIQ